MTREIIAALVMTALVIIAGVAITAAVHLSGAPDFDRGYLVAFAVVALCAIVAVCAGLRGGK